MRTEDLEDYESEVELQLYREYKDVCPMFRYWVETERRGEFSEATEATRAAWAWRRYVAAARSVPDRTLEVRYEEIAADPAAAAERIAARLETDPAPLAAALGAVHSRSIGRWRRDLSKEQVEDVEHEAGSLLRELGYD